MNTFANVNLDLLYEGRALRLAQLITARATLSEAERDFDVKDATFKTCEEVRNAHRADADAEMAKMRAGQAVTFDGSGLAAAETAFDDAAQERNIAGDVMNAAQAVVNDLDSQIAAINAEIAAKLASVAATAASGVTLATPGLPDPLADLKVAADLLAAGRIQESNDAFDRFEASGTSFPAGMKSVFERSYAGSFLGYNPDRDAARAQVASWRSANP